MSASIFEGTRVDALPLAQLVGTIEAMGDWVDEALCSQTDPERFHPERGESTAEAKKVCLRCAVSGACLSYALAADEKYGVWGGKSARERRRMRAEHPSARRVA